MTIEPGAKACARVRELAAIVRKIIDIVNVSKNVVRIKKKNVPASRFRFVMK